MKFIQKQTNTTHKQHKSQTNKGHQANVIISIDKLSFHVSPLGDTTAPVGPLEGWVTLEEGKANLLQEKGQTFRLPI